MPEGYFLFCMKGNATTLSVFEYINQDWPTSCIKKIRVVDHEESISNGVNGGL